MSCYFIWIYELHRCYYTNLGSVSGMLLSPLVSCQHGPWPGFDPDQPALIFPSTIQESAKDSQEQCGCSHLVLEECPIGVVTQ